MIDITVVTDGTGAVILFSFSRRAMKGATPLSGCPGAQDLPLPDMFKGGKACLLILKMEGYPSKLLIIKDDQNVLSGYPSKLFKTIDL